jgi:hypothetical protein
MSGPLISLLASCSSRTFTQSRWKSALALLGVLAVAMQPLVPMVANACLVGSGQAEVCANCSMERAETPSCHEIKEKSASCHDNDADASCCELKATDLPLGTDSNRAVTLNRHDTSLPSNATNLTYCAVPSEARASGFQVTSSTLFSNAPPQAYLSTFLRL